MSPTEQVDLDALEKLHAAATQGEWKWQDWSICGDADTGPNRNSLTGDPSPGSISRANEESGRYGFAVNPLRTRILCADDGVDNPVDMEYIAAAHNALPSLIAELRELRELVGCATHYRVGRCIVLTIGGLWDVRTPNDKQNRYHLSLTEALAAAREWEGKNA